MQARRYSIYAITNTKTHTVYVGSTKRNPFERFDEHSWLLQRGEHFNELLQAAYDTDGPDVFEFSMLDRVSYRSEAMARERQFANEFPAVYNIRGTKHGKGRTRSPVTLETVKRVKGLLAAGATGKAVAKLVGISEGSVSLIKNNVLHKFVTADPDGTWAPTVLKQKRQPQSREHRRSISLGVARYWRKRRAAEAELQRLR